MVVLVEFKSNFKKVRASIDLFTLLLACDFMEDQIKSEMSARILEGRVEEIQKVKDKFNRIMMQKVGKLLVEEISKVSGSINFSQNQYTILKLPKFLKSLLNYFKNDQLLIETGLLFIVYSLHLLTDEMQISYEKNIASFKEKRDELLKMKDLLWLNIDLTPECVCKFRVPSSIFPAYPLFEKFMPDLAIFGILKIFEWLNLLNSSVGSLIANYEASFNTLYKQVISEP